MKQRRWPASVVPKQLVEFAPKFCVLARAHELLGQLLERRDQSFRNIAASELAPMPVLIRFASCDSRFLHGKLPKRRSAYQTVGCLDRSDKIFNRAMIFDARCALNATANVNGVWINCCDRLANVLRVQTARENEESGERQRCSRGRPIAGQASAAPEIGMMRINKHITIRKRRDLFGAEPCVSGERSNDAKFTSEFACRLR